MKRNPVGSSVVHLGRHSWIAYDYAPQWVDVLRQQGIQPVLAAGTVWDTYLDGEVVR